MFNVTMLNVLLLLLVFFFNTLYEPVSQIAKHTFMQLKFGLNENSHDASYN